MAVYRSTGVSIETETVRSEVVMVCWRVSGCEE